MRNRIFPLAAFVALAITLIGSSSAAAQQTDENWPQFRGPRASGLAEGKPAPVKWNAETGENLLWKTEIPGLAHASPIVWGDRVFVVTAVSSNPNPFFRHGLFGDVDSDKDQSKHTWKLYCLDKKTGRILWERVSYEGVPRVKRHIKGTHANSTPVTDGRHVVAFFGSEGLYCYDFDGKLKWKLDLGTLDSGWFYDPDYQWGMASSPVIYKDMVILQCDVQQGSYIAAWDVKTGKQMWKTNRDEIPSWGSPTVVESTVNGKPLVQIVTNATGGVRGYEAHTGAELWHLRGNPEITSTTPIAAHDLIFVANRYRPNQPIYAIRPGATGDISLKDGKESNEHVAWSKQRGGSYQPTPIIYGDHLYIADNNGALGVYEAKTGERVYQQRIGDKGGSYSASPVASGGRIYFSSEDGEIFVIRAGPKYELLSSNPMGEVLMATPAISDGMIIVRGQKHVFAVAEKTGK
ncbi:MAG: PQQ-binding-like beta-propeller repeat protein [Blastocatellales bacterium]|nr:PQQ-binding-like beta-propeller repeat protein [Blastocatellales bacterium]